MPRCLAFCMCPVKNTAYRFNLRVNSWWKSNNTPGTPVNPLNSLLSLLNNGIGGISGSHGTVSELENLGSLNEPVSDFLNSQDSYTTSKPKAFVNWILFDEQFNFVSETSGFEQVGNSNDFVVCRFLPMLTHHSCSC